MVIYFFLLNSYIFFFFLILISRIVRHIGVYTMSVRFRHVLTDLCHVVHVVNNVFGLWDDFIFGQQRVHDVHSFRAHVVRQLINREIVVLVEQRHCNRHVSRFRNHILPDVESIARSDVSTITHGPM